MRSSTGPSTCVRRSRSARTTNWLCAMMRVLSVVGRLTSVIRFSSRVVGARVAQLRAHALARAVGADDADERGAHAERAQVREDVGRAAEAHRLAPYVHDGDGRLRRDARHVAPHELVEHHVAVDGDAAPAHRGDDLSHAFCCQMHNRQ